MQIAAGAFMILAACAIVFALVKVFEWLEKDND